MKFHIDYGVFIFVFIVIIIFSIPTIVSHFKAKNACNFCFKETYISYKNSAINRNLLLVKCENGQIVDVYNGILREDDFGEEIYDTSKPITFC